MRPTAHESSVRKYGKVFLKTFPRIKKPHKGIELEIKISETHHEAKLGIVINYGTVDLAAAKLGFTKTRVVVESIQGLIKGNHARAELHRLTTTLGMPWPNALLHQIESHAQACGFKEVIIRLPETMYYYTKPSDVGLRPKDPEAIRAGMRKFYARVAEANGYVSDGKEFYVKRL